MPFAQEARAYRESPAWRIVAAMKSLRLLGLAAADPRLALMLGLGFSSGLPFLLIFSTQ